ncbi:MAG: PAS domain S-box protein [Spirochaetota bacterium]
MGRTRRAMLNIMDDLGEKTRELARENEERLRSEEHSRESEAFLKAFIDNSTAIIFAKDVEGRYILGNAAWERIVGLSREQAIGKTDYELFPEDLADSYRLNDLEVQNHSRVLENEEIVVVDGERRTFISAKFPIPGLDGRPKATCGMLTDITERKSVEKAIRENEKQLRTIFEGSPLGMIHMSEEGTIIDCNEKFVELMGSSRAKLIGFNSVRQGKDAAMITALSKALAGETAEYESNYTSATGGKTIPIHMKFNPVNVGQDPTEVIVTLEDISERKKVEQELKEHLEELEKFNRLTINREVKMIELKAEINALLEKAGEAGKYKIVV